MGIEALVVAFVKALLDQGALAPVVVIPSGICGLFWFVFIRPLNRRVAVVESAVVSVRGIESRLNDFFVLLREALSRGAVQAGTGLISPGAELLAREWEKMARRGGDQR